MKPFETRAVAGVDHHGVGQEITTYSIILNWLSDDKYKSERHGLNPL